MKKGLMLVLFVSLAFLLSLAPNLCAEEGVTDILVCEELGIGTRLLRRWRDEFRLLGDDAFPGQGRNRDEELTQLKRELAKVKQERDFLKDAAVFFAKESK